ncbi:hypothetical protein FF1_042226 [Malus domestica]
MFCGRILVCEFPRIMFFYPTKSKTILSGKSELETKYLTATPHAISETANKFTIIRMCCCNSSTPKGEGNIKSLEETKREQVYSGHSKPLTPELKN